MLRSHLETSRWYSDGTGIGQPSLYHRDVSKCDLNKENHKELQAAGWADNTPVAVVQRASWPDQKIVRTTLSELDEAMRVNGIRKHAMILAGWALDPHIHEKEYRSKLYDKTFTHGFRKGVTAND